MTPLLAQRVRVDRSFERIYRRHLGDVYRYSLAVLRNQPDAEDVTQTTFLNAYRAYQRGERPRNPQNWLIAIAHNVCRQRFRQAQRRPDEVEYDDGIAEVVPEEEHGPTVEDIQRALGHLAFNQRAALVMRELEGRSYAEIAQILELSVSAVETLLFRARRALREQLDGSLTCVEAERAISLQVDGKLPRTERGALRAHLRECAACERLARSHRAQRSAFKALAAIPIPSSLTSLFGGGSTAVGTAVGAKAAAVVAAGVVVTGVGYEGAKVVNARPHESPALAPVVVKASTRQWAATGVDRVEARRAATAATAVSGRAEAQAVRANVRKPTPRTTLRPDRAKKAEHAASAARANRRPARRAATPTPPRRRAAPAHARPARQTHAARPKVVRRVKVPRPRPAKPKPTPAPAPAAPEPPSNGGKEKDANLVELPQLPVSLPPLDLP